MLKETCLISYILSNDFFTKYLVNSIKDLIESNHIYIKDDSVMSKLYNDNILLRVHSKKRRLNYYKNKLTLLKQKYKNFIVTDNDCRLFCNMNGWTELFEFIHKSEKQLFFMRDDITNDIHTGFFILKDSYVDAFIDYIKKTLLHDGNDLSSHHLALTNLKQDLSYEFIPSKFIISGNKFTILHKKYYVVHHLISSRNDTNEKNDKLNQINIITRYMKDIDILKN